MNKEEQILQILKRHHVGEEEAVIGKDLAFVACITESELRKIVNSLRSKSEPICSSHSGYYYANTKTEIRETVQHLKNRVSGINNAVEGLEQLLK